MAKFKLKKNIKPFTEELFIQLCEKYGNPLVFNWENQYDDDDDNYIDSGQTIMIYPKMDENWNVINPFVPERIDVSSYYNINGENKDSSVGNFYYAYVFESAIDDALRSKGVVTEGWYSCEFDYDIWDIAKYDLISDENKVVELFQMPPIEYRSKYINDWDNELLIDPFLYEIMEKQYNGVTDFLSEIADVIRFKTNQVDKIKGADLIDKMLTLPTWYGGKVYAVHEDEFSYMPVFSNNVYKVTKDEYVYTPVPSVGTAKTISNVRFTRNMAGWNFVELCKKIFPSLLDFENYANYGDEKYYIYYQDDNNCLSIEKKSLSLNSWSIGIKYYYPEMEDNWPQTICSVSVAKEDSSPTGNLNWYNDEFPGDIITNLNIISVNHPECEVGTKNDLIVPYVYIDDPIPKQVEYMYVYDDDNNKYELIRKETE